MRDGVRLVNAARGVLCDDCGRPEALRQANRRRKQKMAEARRLHAEGVAAGEIAKRLDTKPATVRGWVKKAR